MNRTRHPLLFLLTGLLYLFICFEVNDQECAQNYSQESHDYFQQDKRPTVVQQQVTTEAPPALVVVWVLMTWLGLVLLAARSFPPRIPFFVPFHRKRYLRFSALLI